MTEQRMLVELLARARFADDGYEGVKWHQLDERTRWKYRSQILDANTFEELYFEKPNG